MDDFFWDENGGPIIYAGDIPIDMNSPPFIGDEVRLQYKGYEFDVTIEEEGDGEFSGAVIRIGPVPSIEAEGISRGDYVSFCEDHVLQLARARAY